MGTINTLPSDSNTLNYSGRGTTTRSASDPQLMDPHDHEA
jgi:hypothetical protein